MSGLTKRCFPLLDSIISASNHKNASRYVIKKSRTEPTLIDINLYPNKYNQELCYYSFAISLDRCARSSNTCDDLTSRVCAPKISESITLTKHISCKCESKFDDRKCNLNQNWNNGKCRCDRKNPKEHQC